ncbi:lantibiotic dehydratase [Flammeovirga sp. OC4]|uniref:lantibiotic dehydratase n=1 Tax=Flammeovirga sp. OC4 TaxID=1382345 RepID=UPI0005C46B2A|nr:lantibiotic dehydratase [Flammeovirga sp. OC4]
MKNNTLENIPFGFIRTPLLPFKENIEDWTKHFNNDFVKKAIYFASPNLYDLLSEDINQLSDALKQTFLKYYLRMSYRCTPFGLFSGVSTYRLNHENTKIELSEFPKANIRLDTYILGLLYRKLIRNKNVVQLLKFYPNDTIRCENSIYKYVEQVFDENELRNYKLSKVDYLPILDKILTSSNSGLSIDDIVNICTKEGFGDEDSLEFAEELIDNNLLISEFHFNVVGDVYHNVIRKLIVYLEKKKINIKHLNYYKDVLSDIENIQHSINSDIQEKLEMILSKKVDPQLIFQVDSYFSANKSMVNNNNFDEIESLYRLYMGINPKEEKVLGSFIEEFSQKYEEQYIDLLEVLDPINGINFPSNNGLNILPKEGEFYGTNHSSNSTFKTINFNPEWESFIYQKLEEKKNITLTDQDCIRFMYKGNIDSSIIGVKASLLKYKTFVEFVHHSNPIKFIGRFSHLDEEISKGIDQLVSIEDDYYKNSNTLLAEVAFVHNNLRASNVCHRSKFRHYTIPIIQPTQKDDSHILLNDIIVGIRNNEVILRSKKTKKRILPRISNAHFIKDDHLNIYAFFSKIEQQGMNKYPLWNWGTYGLLDHLPRVTYKNYILAKEEWAIYLNEVNSLNELKDYLLKKEVTKIITFADGDREMPIRINHQDSLKVLWDELQKKKRLRIKECLFNENNLVVNKDGKYTTNETLLYFKNKSKPATQLDEEVIVDQGDVKRSFNLGEEWLYLKIYMVDSFADEKFLTQLYPLIHELYESKVIEDWHFIRYIDPKFHIRLRFKGQENFYEKVIQAFNAYFGHLFGKEIHKHIYDVYNRELERYYFHNIELSERLFSIDSTTIIQLLPLVQEKDHNDLRWNLSFKLIDDLLNAFDFHLNYKKYLLMQLADGFKREFNFTSKSDRKQLAQKFRKTKTAIYKVIDDQSYSEEIAYVLNRRYLELSHISNGVKENLKHNQNDIAQLLSSYIHMLMNRWNSADFRRTEMIIYDMLSQFYKEKENRIKHLQPQTN